MTKIFAIIFYLSLPLLGLEFEDEDDPPSDSVAINIADIDPDFLKSFEYLPDDQNESADSNDLSLLQLQVLAANDLPPVMTKSMANLLRHDQGFRVKTFLKKHAGTISFVSTIAASGLVYVGFSLILNQVNPCEDPNAIYVGGLKLVEYDSLKDYIKCEHENESYADLFQYIFPVVAGGMVSVGKFLSDYFSNQFQKTQNEIQDGHHALETLYKLLAKKLKKIYEKRMAFLYRVFEESEDYPDKSFEKFFQLVSLLKPQGLDNIVESEDTTCLLDLNFFQMDQILNKLDYISLALGHSTNAVLTTFFEFRNTLNKEKKYQEFIESIVLRKRELLVGCPVNDD